ncbi:hypothetical protein HAZT_HAZT007891 [Hyalella azteca]|nr:hypothetical protein HAZT_HAZT007891 [Hyalella azteca]
MTTLDHEAFHKTITVPVAHVSLSAVSPVFKVLKKYYLKLCNFSAIKEGPPGTNYKVVYLNPLSFPGNESKISEEIDESCKKFFKTVSSGERPVQFLTSQIELTYENWDAPETIQAVLPLEDNGVSGYSRVGHIIHLNLKEHLHPYKNIIGKIILDKSPTEVSMVVNKVDTIDNSDNTFRCFTMEVIAGGGDTVATVKENMCTFTFDFAKVYWNPRLSTEHEMVVKMLDRSDVLYDVMAGVGPFSIPAAAQRKCRVVSNDLNPESFRWLCHNVALNKVGERVTCFNQDGGDFIRSTLKEDLIATCTDPDFQGEIHVTMNLPAIAIEFLTNFVGLLSDANLCSDTFKLREPIVHVYMFSKDLKASSCATRVAYYLGLVDELPDFDAEFTTKLQAYTVAAKSQKSACDETCKETEAFTPNIKFVNDKYDIPGLIVKHLRFVRKVSPNKAMIRMSVVISKDILVKKKPVLDRREGRLQDQHASKKRKLETENF